MSRFRRSLTVVAVSSLGLSLLSTGASAEETAPVASQGPASSRAVVAEDAPEQVARGIIVETTTSAPTDAALDATDDALGKAADVADDSKLTGKISTIDFDQEVPADVASDVAAEVQARPDVVWAMPNTLVRKSDVPAPVKVNDPLFSRQWNLWDSAAKPSTSGGYSIKSRTLWRKTQGAPDVRVAVLDTGILADHPDMGNVVPGYDMIGADDPKASKKTYKVANDGDGRDADPSDPGDWVTAGQCGKGQKAYPSSWHGTFVAGQIAARTDNQKSIAGIASRASVQPVRVLGRCGGWDSDILAGITWASGGHVAGIPDNETPSQIVNLSLGAMYSSATSRNRACTAYAAAAKAGNARGSVFVAAAGNDGGNANLVVPASCPGFISVGATGRKGFSATYSNIGSSVDLVAPGGDTLVVPYGDRTDELITSLGSSGKTVPTNRSTMLAEGTSMAAPAVAGGAALIYTLLRDAGTPTYENGQEVSRTKPTAAQVESAIYASVSPFPTKNPVWAKKKVVIGKYYYLFDLNCSGHSWCGRGTFDLNRVPAALTPMMEPLGYGYPGSVNSAFVAPDGDWIGGPKLRYRWSSGGEPVGSNSSRYYPTAGDDGKEIKVAVSPAAAAFGSFEAVSYGTVKVGPVVTLTVPPGPHAAGDTVTATVVVTPRPGFPTGETVLDSTVHLRSDNSESGVNLGQAAMVDGQGTITFRTDLLPVGTGELRAAYAGNGGTSWSASSDPSPFEVRKATSVVATKLPATATASAPGAVEIAVRVANIPDPDGRVSVYIDGRGYKNTPLYSGGTRTLPLPKLAKGRHSVKVTYSGSAKISGATSVTRYVTVK